MAPTAAPPASTPAPRVEPGVAPLRAGQGRSFLLRRLHSLSGIFPVGFYLIEHMVSNAFATNGPKAYAKQVEFLVSFPFLIVIETTFIFLPILFHSVYGFYIWYRGESNLGDYPWTGNWMYAAQRWTGGLAFAYMAFHTWEMRFSGVHLIDHPGAAFGKVQLAFENPWVLIFYVAGIVAATWHFSYGVWLFAAKWGITVGEQARQRFGYVCFAMAIVFLTVWMMTVRSFLVWPRQPLASVIWFGFPGN